MKLRILLAMLVLTVLMAVVVLMASPYAPVVAPAPEDIQMLWDIEDAREESEAPLVTALENDGVPLAYDAQANRFYCTLGLGREESWPQIHLTAPGAEGVSLVFSDDYTYDWCADALRDNYAYQAMAYTDTQYHYFEIVFTGLPQLQIVTGGQEITTEDASIRVIGSAYGEEPLDTTARAHLRGASTLIFDKKSFKVEFTRERSGMTKKTAYNVPGFGMADQIALLPCWHDQIKMRDRLNWDLWAELAVDDEPFGARRTQYVELFLDGAYWGVYLMAEPVDVKEELSLAGENRLLSDSVYRTAALNFSRDREYVDHPYRDNAGYELYYAPVDAAPFAGLEAYLDLVTEEDDAAFAQKALACIDMDNALRHLLFVQGCGLADNVFNNMYIWAQRENGKTTYRFSLWDLDLAWGFERESIGEEYENWMHFPVIDRMLRLDVGGIRQKAYDMWQTMRASIFSEEALEARVAQYTMELGESGALMREAERWGGEMFYPDGYELISFAAMRWPLIDEAMALLLHQQEIGYLTQSNYTDKGGSIWPSLE